MPKPGFRRAFYELGCRISDRGADMAGHPAAIVLVILFCAVWFLLPLGDTATAVLTLVLSVLAITLTQMVLNQQKRHEAALHLKIDELIHAMKGARDEVMGIENKSEAELEALASPATGRRRCLPGAAPIRRARCARRCENWLPRMEPSPTRNDFACRRRSLHQESPE